MLERLGFLKCVVSNGSPETQRPLRRVVSINGKEKANNQVFEASRPTARQSWRVSRVRRLIVNTIQKLPMRLMKIGFCSAAFLLH